MTIVFYIHSLRGGGAERVTSTLANHFVRQGWSVVLVSNLGKELDFYELEPSIERIELGQHGDSRNKLAGLLANWRRVRALRRILKSTVPQAAISMTTTANCVLAFAGQGLNIRLIGSERIHPPMWPLGRVWDIVRRRAYPMLDTMVAQTARTAEWLLANTPGTNVAIVPNPVELPLAIKERRLRPENLNGLVSGAPILLAVGRLVRQKGFDVLIEAFADVAAECKNWTLVILGEGAARPELEKLVAECDVADRCLMPGAVGNVGEWYEVADLFVLSSRFEGFPNCLLEAMAHRLAAVAVDCDTGPRDIIRDQIDGILVPQSSVDDLSAALRMLMTDDARRNAMAARSAEVLERFSVERVAEAWMRLVHNEGGAGANAS